MYRFSLQCYVSKDIAIAVRRAADERHMSVSQWLKNVIIETLDDDQNRSVDEQLLRQTIFASIALDAILAEHPNDKLRDRAFAAYHRQLKRHGLTRPSSSNEDEE